MSPATVELIAAIVQMLMSLAAQVPAFVALGEQAVSLLKSNTDPTPEQEATIRAALDAANAGLQSA